MMSCYDKKCNVSSMLRELGWESLQECRSKYRLNLLGKFEEDIFSDDVKHILRLPSYYGRRDHEKKIKEIDCNTERLKMSFFPRTIKDSNGVIINRINSVTR